MFALLTARSPIIHMTQWVSKNRDFMEEHAEFIKEERKHDFDFLPSLKAVFKDFADWKRIRIKVEVVPLYISV